MIPNDWTLDNLYHVLRTNKDLMERIIEGLVRRGYEVKLGPGAGEDAWVIRCQVTPNSLLELGIGKSRPLVMRYRSGKDEAADAYFREDVEELFTSLRNFLKRTARSEGYWDTLKERYASRWIGSEWEADFAG